MDTYAPLDPHDRQKILAAANEQIRFWHLLDNQVAKELSTYAI